VTATSAVRPASAADERARPLGRHSTLALAGLYYLLAALAVTLWLWRDPASRMVAGNPNDADQMAWFFRYDATAIAHFHLPALVTTAMNAPQGVNAMWNTFMLLPGVVLAPLTLIAGAQTSMTVLMTLGFAGSALAMFFVLRRWDVSVPAAALGGALYGFSPAISHSAIGHYDLQFLVFPPLIIDAALRVVLGRVSARRGGVVLGLLVTAQLFITEEILFDTAVAGAVLLAALSIRRYPHLHPLAGLGSRAARARVKTVAVGLGIGCAVTLVIAGYPLWVQFFGPLPQHGSPFTTDFFKNDISGLVVPSALMVIHTSGTAATAANYQGQLPEYLGYLGWPLLIVLIAATIRFWRRPVIRALAVTWLVTDVFSLGGTLLVSGHAHPAVKLPWYWVQGLPLLNAVLPDRFSIVADGAAAALLAFAVDAAVPAFAVLAVRRLPRLAAGRRPALVVMCFAALIVLPVVPTPLPVTTATPLPPGWPAVFNELRLPRSATVLVVPIPMSTFTEPLRWQADSGEPGAMVGGYFMGPAWNGHAFIDGNGTPAAGLFLDQLWKASAAALPAVLTAESPTNSSPTSGKYVPVKAVTEARMRAQLAAWKVSVVVAVTTPDSALAQYLMVLLGRPVAAAGDVLAWRGPAAG
jgi:dolichyl-phosphate beta-glucosyltransferase